MKQYTITEGGLVELDKYFIEHKDSLIRIAWKNLKDREICQCDPQAERDKVLQELFVWVDSEQTITITADKIVKKILSLRTTPASEQP